MKTMTQEQINAFTDDERKEWVSAWSNMLTICQYRHAALKQAYGETDDWTTQCEVSLRQFSDMLSRSSK